LRLPALEQVEYATEEEWMEDVVGHAAWYLKKQEVDPSCRVGRLALLPLYQMAEHAQESLQPKEEEISTRDLRRPGLGSLQTL
jgi:hypothetical protein